METPGTFGLFDFYTVRGLFFLLSPPRFLSCVWVVCCRLVVFFRVFLFWETEEKSIMEKKQYEKKNTSSSRSSEKEQEEEAVSIVAVRRTASTIRGTVGVHMRVAMPSTTESVEYAGVRDPEAHHQQPDERPTYYSMVSALQIIQQ